MLIKDLHAIEQPLDFETLSHFCSCMSDVDGILQLNNGSLVVLEIKKASEKHKWLNIKNRPQISLLKKFIGNRVDIYFIYAVHNQPIDINIPIELNSCEVLCVENNGEVLTQYENTALIDCIQDLAKFKIEKNKFYLMVKYQDGTLEYCISSPKGKVWSTSKYIEDKVTFDNCIEVENYIEARYQKSFNQKNEYWLFRKENGSDTLIRQFKYSG